MIYYIMAFQYKLYWGSAVLSALSALVLFFEIMGLIFGKKRFARKIKNFNWGWIIPLALGVGAMFGVKKMYPEGN